MNLKNTLIFGVFVVGFAFLVSHAIFGLENTKKMFGLLPDLPFNTQLYNGILASSVLFSLLFIKTQKKVGSPSEFQYLVRYLLFYKKPEIPKGVGKHDEFSYRTLTKVSRSFSAVILELNDELKRAICCFYLVLRGLDTVEDDMQIPKEEKIPMLRDFHNVLNRPGWNSRKGYGKTNIDEMKLLEDFQHVIQVYQELKPEYQNAIKEICDKMGNGMADFIEKRVVSIADYNLYCHYVAGLVGIGLSKLFKSSGLEGNRFDRKDIDHLSNEMGLFLQKTNIIRDYLEDILEQPPRIFYPKEIWQHYAERIEDLKEPENKTKALECLNHMVTNVLELLPSVFEYMSLVKDPSVFKFAGVPQIMAIATLERCYNNYDVFRTEVKIRKGEAVRLMMECKNFRQLILWFQHYLTLMQAKVPTNDPNAQKTHRLIDSGLEMCKQRLNSI